MPKVDCTPAEQPETTKELYENAMDIAELMIRTTDNRFAKQLGRLIQVCAQHWQNYADPTLVPFTSREELVRSLNYELDEVKREIWK